MALETGSFYSGDRRLLEYRGRVDLNSQIGVEPTISYNWIGLPEGRFHNSLSTNARFRWEYLPGSELFIVFFEGRSTEPASGMDALQDRGVIVKVNRLFRW